MASLSARAVEWAGRRGISRSSLEQAGVGSGTAEMPGQGKCEVIAFPYRRDGKVVNVKYRALGAKAFRQRSGGELRFWQLDGVLAGAKEQVFITEGEMDYLALLEAGLDAEQLTSVPNGAPVAPSDDPAETDRYKFVLAGLAEGLAQAKRFVLATDNDPPGLALRQDLVRLLGMARCYFIDWPDGIKDANDFLLRHGPAKLREFVQTAARVWPVAGLYRLSEMPEPAPLEVWRPGFPEWESKLGFAPTTVSIVTGHPGHGKTTLMMQLWFQICRDYGIKAVLASFETRAKPHHRKNIRQFMFGRLEHELSAAECAHADGWNDDHFRWIVHPQRKPSLAWVLDMAEVAVVRHGCRAVQIDPWNKLEADRPENMRETDYIGQALDASMDFARDMDCHVQILAHPAKMDSKFRGAAPTLEDISGSKHWDNKPDLGLCINRGKLFDKGERQTKANLYVLKSRLEELGYPCCLDLDYDLGEGRFKSIDYRTGPV